MSVVAAIRKMIAGGFSMEQALFAAEAMEEAALASKTSPARAERNARYYEANREKLVAKAAERRVVKTSESTETSENRLNASELIKTSEPSELRLNASESCSPSRVHVLAEPELTKLEITGKKKKERKKSAPVTYPPEFNLLVHEFREHDRTVKSVAYELWAKLSEADQDRCLDAIGPYEESLERERRGGFNRSKCGLQVFIRQRRFDDLLSQVAA